MSVACQWKRSSPTGPAEQFPGDRARIVVEKVGEKGWSVGNERERK